MITTKFIRELDEKLGGIDDIRFILYPSSWGALSCIIEVPGAEREQYQSWVGDAGDKVTVKLLLQALSLAFEVKQA